MSAVTVQTKWWKYDQNNSFGRFEGPAINVFVEATDADDANRRAAKAGLYFDGDRDCPCCGNRWSEAGVYSDAADERPDGESSAYDHDKRYATRHRIPLCAYVHFDGRIETSAVAESKGTP